MGGVASTKLQKIIKLQKKCIRNVAGRGYRSHTDPLFSKLEILKFEDLFKFTSSTFMHKYMSGKLPISFKEMFTPLPPPNRTNGFTLEKPKNKFLQQFPQHFLPRIWNVNSLFIKLVEKPKTFKRELKCELLKSYEKHVKCYDLICDLMYS